jgi:hypothetical protein
MPGSADKFTQLRKLDCVPGMTSLKPLCRAAMKPPASVKEAPDVLAEQAKQLAAALG